MGITLIGLKTPLDQDADPKWLLFLDEHAVVVGHDYTVDRWTGMVRLLDQAGETVAVGKGYLVRADRCHIQRITREEIQDAMTAAAMSNPSKGEEEPMGPGMYL